MASVAGKAARVGVAAVAAVVGTYAVGVRAGFRAGMEAGAAERSPSDAALGNCVGVDPMNDIKFVLKAKGLPTSKVEVLERVPVAAQGVRHGKELAAESRDQSCVKAPTFEEMVKAAEEAARYEGRQ